MSPWVAEELRQDFLPPSFYHIPSPLSVRLLGKTLYLLCCIFLENFWGHQSWRASHFRLPFASPSFPNKQKSAEPSPTVMSSSLGSNLSELDRLLLELNAVQHNPPGFPTGRSGSLGQGPARTPGPWMTSGSLEGLGPSSLSLSVSQDEANSSPPLPGALSPHYGIPENNSPLGGKAGTLTKEKPKRNGGRGLEDVRPSVESLLDELESSVPSPV